MGSPLSARAVEALTGAGIGGLGVGAVSAITHEPRQPLEWLDEDGNFHSRNATPIERREYRDRILKAALLGASIGAGASLGVSKFRRYSLAQAEKDALPEILKERLSGLRNVLSEFEDSAAKAKIPGTAEQALRQARVGRAKQMLSAQERRLEKLLGDAEAARSGAAWGGLKLTGGGKTPVPHEDLTHRGRVERYFRDMQSEVQKENPKHPPLQSITDPEEYGQRFFRTLLKKEASAHSLARELGDIYESYPLISSRILFRLADTQAGM